jgi:hypothetical protein
MRYKWKQILKKHKGFAARCSQFIDNYQKHGGRQAPDDATIRQWWEDYQDEIKDDARLRQSWPALASEAAQSLKNWFPRAIATRAKQAENAGFGGNFPLPPPHHFPPHHLHYLASVNQFATLGQGGAGAADAVPDEAVPPPAMPLQNAAAEPVLPNGDVNALHQLMHGHHAHLADDPMAQAQGAIEASVFKACGPYLPDAVQALKQHKRRFASFDKSPSRSTLGEPYEVKPSLGKHREKYKYLPYELYFFDPELAGVQVTCPRCSQQTINRLTRPRGGQGDSNGPQNNDDDQSCKLDRDGYVCRPAIWDRGVIFVVTVKYRCKRQGAAQCKHFNLFAEAARRLLPLHLQLRFPFLVRRAYENTIRVYACSVLLCCALSLLIVIPPHTSINIDIRQKDVSYRSRCSPQNRSHVGLCGSLCQQLERRLCS